MKSYKIGAVFYALWGLLHIVGGGMILTTAMGGGATAAQPLVWSTLPAADLPVIAAGAVDGVFSYYGWLILLFGLYSLVVGVKLNWKNDPVGYWSNLLLLTGVEIGLTVFLLLPGFIRVAEGMLGISLFLAAAAFTTVGAFGSKKTSGGSA